VALHENISAPVSVMNLVEVSKNATSLAVCARKNIVWLGGAVFL